jgi:hypothetical protein
VSEPDREGFLTRWARRKRAAGETADAAPPADAADKPPADAAREAPAAEAAHAADPPAFDLSTLPPIDQITAATDIRPFLAPGVPAELTRAALRRAWVADPQIRDFVGIAENQWDFTDPNAIPGFGTLGPLDDVARLVARVVGGMDDLAGLAPPAASAASPSAAEPLPAESPTASVAAGGESGGVISRQPDAAPPATDLQRKDPAREETEAAAPQKGTGPNVPMRRAHGGALPT